VFDLGAIFGGKENKEDKSSHKKLSQVLKSKGKIFILKY